MSKRRHFLAVGLPSLAATVFAPNRGGSCQSRISDALKLMTTPITTDSKTIRLTIDAASIDSSDAYRLAVVEEVHDHFSHLIVVDPQSKLKLYIYGTNLDGTHQYVAIDFGWEATQIIRKGVVPAVATGFFTYVRSGEIIAGDKNERVQVVKEMTYKMLSDFEKKEWPKVR